MIEENHINVLYYDENCECHKTFTLKIFPLKIMFGQG